jgi:hypothetical protein
MSNMSSQKVKAPVPSTEGDAIIFKSFHSAAHQGARVGVLLAHRLARAAAGIGSE